MEYRVIGHTGVHVSAICLGTMNFGVRTEEADAVHIIDAALDAGINFIDTANTYGHGESERIVGRALKRDQKRDEVFLATKFSGGREGTLHAGNSRYHMMESVEQSLHRLDTDRIDLYYFHVMDLSVSPYEAMHAADTLVRQGKVRHAAVSKWAPSRTAEAQMLAERYGWTRLVCEQPPYNLLDRSIENEMIYNCQRHGMGIAPWGPLASNVLTGRYAVNDAGEIVDAVGGRKVPESRLTPEAVRVAGELGALAEEQGCSLAEFATAWVLRQPGITAPIIGPSRLEHLESSLRALEVTFTEDDHQRIDALCPPGSAISPYYEPNVAKRIRRAIGVEPRPTTRHNAATKAPA